MIRKRLHILVATPLGRGGRGGIDRLMDSIRSELGKDGSKGVNAYFAATRGKGPLLFSLFLVLAFLVRMVALRLLGRCDLVHVNVAPRGSSIRKALICRLARVLGIRTVVHLHGSGYDAFWREATPAMRACIRDMFSHASVVIVLGKLWHEFVIAERLALPAHVVVLPNAAPVSNRCQVVSRTGAVRIVFLGALGARKGIPELLEALSRLRDRQDWIAMLAGDGEIEETRSAITALDLDKQVLVPGWLESEEIANLLANADILVLPSVAENLPMSVIEGMAAGLAVIATSVGATPEIIEDGKNGLLVAPGRVNDLEHALRRLIENRDLRLRLGEAAQAFHRQHLDIAVYTRRLCALWEEAASGASPNCQNEDQDNVRNSMVENLEKQRASRNAKTSAAVQRTDATPRS